MKLFNGRAVKWTSIFVLLLVAGISIGVIIDSHLDDRSNKKKQQELLELYGQSSSGSTSQSEPLPGESSFANPQFAQLLKINPDLIGWVEVGGYSGPVVQADNNSFYLTHDFYGKEDKHGTIFLDTRNSLDPADDNLVLYGHNYNKSQQIFYEVEQYKTPDYASKYPVITLTTLNEKQHYLVFAAFMANTNPELGEVFDYHNRLRFSTTDEMNGFLAQVTKQSLIRSPVEADSADYLLTLSTCGYDFDGQRYVVMARRLRPDETLEQAAVNQFTKAENPLLPEAWLRLYGSDS